MNEEWREIPRYSRYRVSNLGRIWSKRDQRVKALKVDRAGYYQTRMVNDDGRPKFPRVHVLVALAFLGPRPEGIETRHLDGNKLNCTVSNLKYGTKRENMDDRYRLNEWAFGERHGRAKLDNGKVRKIKQALASGERHKDIAARFGVGRSTISMIRNGTNWAEIAPAST